MEFTQHELEQYWNALKEAVCSKCRKSGYERSCRIGTHGICPFDIHLPRLVEAVLTTPRSTRIADYIPNIRAMVCSHCENQDTQGRCLSREMASCGIDSYLVVVVQTIEDIHDRLQSRLN